MVVVEQSKQAIVMCDSTMMMVWREELNRHKHRHRKSADIHRDTPAALGMRVVSGVKKRHFLSSLLSCFQKHRHAHTHTNTEPQREAARIEK